MNRSIYPPPVVCDFYKTGHYRQFVEGTEGYYATWIPRQSLIEGINKIISFGFQYFCKAWLQDFFNDYFFGRPKEEVLAEYRRYMHYTLNIGDTVDDVPDEHFSKLHDLGYIPVRVTAIPEGMLVPLRVPMLTIENTHPDFAWVVNWLETLFSAECWQMSTSATIAFEYRKDLTAAAKATGGSLDFVPFQGHDFSMRGMEGLEAAAKSGAGHLLSFVGTDTIPAISFLEHYYNANIETELVGTSIPATEHSVMCAYGSTDEEELECYRELITKRYPNGFISIVSDTRNLWDVLTEVLPKLKDDIMARDGKVVIRPDSGDPVDIICGLDPAALSGYEDHREVKGVVELLWDLFGGTINEEGYKELDSHIGDIYGDSISLARERAINDRLQKKGFASTNVVYGIGSFTYQYVTRDTFGFALKSTWVKIKGIGKAIFKDPATDRKKTKKSLKGRVSVYRSDADGNLGVIDGLSELQEQALAPGNILRPIFVDGTLVVDDSLADIRARIERELLYELEG